jgi:alpha-beta hydrolase superfamily lysophospholipase
MMPLHIPFVALLLSGWAQPTPATTVDVRIPTGGIELAATLTLPSGSGPHPAVVLLSGSGPSTRRELQKFVDLFIARGFATLVYDKRGVGASTGSWTTASFDDNVGDAQAAVARLAADSRIDPRRIGVWGVSQAAWFIPALVNRTPAIGFALVLTGGGATPREVEMFMHNESLTRAAVSPEDRQKAVALLTMYFEWLGSGVGRAALMDAIALAKPTSWYRAVAIDGVLPSDANRPKWEWVAQYDPRPDMAKMTIPTFVALGAADRMGSAPLAADRWRTGLAQAGNTRARVVMIDGMGHAATIGSTHAQGGAVMPDYVTALGEFLAALK